MYLFISPVNGFQHSIELKKADDSLRKQWQKRESKRQCGWIRFVKDLAILHAPIYFSCQRVSTEYWTKEGRRFFRETMAKARKWTTIWHVMARNKYVGEYLCPSLSLSHTRTKAYVHIFIPPAPHPPPHCVAQARQINFTITLWFDFRI